MATNVEDNLRSVVLSHAAIESGHTGRPVQVADVLQRARERRPPARRHPPRQHPAHGRQVVEQQLLPDLRLQR